MVAKKRQGTRAHSPRHKFEVPITTVDLAIFCIDDGTLSVLLTKRAHAPAAGEWSLPGGFVHVDKDASLEKTAHRVLQAKTGVRTAHLEQVESIGNASRDPRGWAITVLYFALIDATAIKPQIDSVEDAQWVTLDKALKAPLAFDHRVLLKKARGRLRDKCRYTALPASLLPKKFTLTELQAQFETVLEYPLQKKSFRRRFEDAGILTDTGESKIAGKRPARLYSLRHAASDYIFPRPLALRGAP